MIPRRLLSALEVALAENSANALLGPRQVGKTTLAFEIATSRPSVYLDLESEADRAKLADPEYYLSQHEQKLVILDEVHRAPQLFRALRGIIDPGRRRGRGGVRFLVLGSAAMDLLKQSCESLAGRIRYLVLAPLEAGEVGSRQLDLLWLRGGFPRSLLAESDGESLRWRKDFIRTYLERDIPQLGPRILAEMLRRLWTMLAHQQGGLLNAAAWARAGGGRQDGFFLTRSARGSAAREASGSLARQRAQADRQISESLRARQRGGSRAAWHRRPGGAACAPGSGGKLGRHGDRVADRRRAGSRGGVLFPDRRRRGNRPAVRALVYGGAERFAIAEGVEAIALPDLCAELAAA